MHAWMNNQTNQVVKTGIRWSAKTTAAKFGVCAKTLKNWANDKQVKFPAPKVIRKRHYYSEAEVRQWAARNPDFAKLNDEEVINSGV